MKKILMTIALFIVSIAWVSAQAKKAAHRTWTLTITPRTQIHYLDSVSKSWAKDSIVLTFTKLEYNADGKLVHLKGSVDATSKGKHASGTFSSDALKSYTIKMDDGPGVYLSGK